MRTSLLLILTAATAAVPVTAQPVMQADRPPIGRIGQTWETVFGACANAQPDRSYLVPRYLEWSERREASPNGGYGHKPNARCNYWIVDYSLNRYTNEVVNPDTGEKEYPAVFFGASPEDLPSSRYQGEVPTTQADCESYELDIYIFRKDPSENVFKLVKQRQGRMGTWNATYSECGTGASVSHEEVAPKSNLTKIRIAVRVKLRGSWQRASANAWKAPPP